MASERERFPELFVDGNVDRRKCERIVPMKILVLGFMRTGSQCVFLSRNRLSKCNCTDFQYANPMVRSAMRHALRHLGYIDTYQMDSVFENPPDCDMWQEAFAAKFHGKGKKYDIKDWDQLLGHCQVWGGFLQRNSFS